MIIVGAATRIGWWRWSRTSLTRRAEPSAQSKVPTTSGYRALPLADGADRRPVIAIPVHQLSGRRFDGGSRGC